MITKDSPTIVRCLRRAWSDTRAAAAIEFALLAPIFLALLFGVLQVGIYLQNYNAVKSLVSDGARLVMIEYQKDNALTDAQIRGLLLARAVNSPYLLDTNRLEIVVDRSGASRITGATEVDIQVRYTLSNFIPGVELPVSTIDYQRPVFVAI